MRGKAHTNTIEGFFSIFKRGINGVYQHVSPGHLQRYLTEFDFRCNERAALGVDDAMRMEKALASVASVSPTGGLVSKKERRFVSMAYKILEYIEDSDRMILVSAASGSS